MMFRASSRMIVATSALFLFQLSTSWATDNAVSTPSENQNQPVQATDQERPRLEVNFTEGLLSVITENADIRRLIEAISEKSMVEISLDKTITGKVTVEFKDIKFEDGLKQILKDVVGGGFATEYVKKGGTKDQFDIQRVVIARQGKGDVGVKEDEVLRISEISVQKADGKEVVFVKWGTGENQIPLMTETINGVEYRKGFATLRVGEDGTLYFINWAHQKIYIYDKEGNPKVTIPFQLQGSHFDVDHEGNIYIMNANDGGAPWNRGMVLIFNPQGKQIGTVTIPLSQALFTRSSVIDDGILKDGTTIGEIYDFRKYLKDQNDHATRKRYLGKMDASPSPHWDNGKSIGKDLIVEGIDNIGLPQKFIKSVFPVEWNSGNDRSSVLGIDGLNRIYCLLSINTPTLDSTKNSYALALVDPASKTIDYYMVSELDDYVYEKESVRNNSERFDIDPQGKVYHLFTTKEGVHIYQYSLGGVK